MGFFQCSPLLQRWFIGNCTERIGRRQSPTKPMWRGSNQAKKKKKKNPIYTSLQCRLTAAALQYRSCTATQCNINEVKITNFIAVIQYVTSGRGPRHWFQYREWYQIKFPALVTTHNESKFIFCSFPYFILFVVSLSSTWRWWILTKTEIRCCNTPEWKWRKLIQTI